MGGLMTRWAMNTLLGQCMVRAMLATGVTDPKAATPWLAVKLTPKASRVASFIVFWAMEMREHGDADIGIEEYSRAGYTSRAKAYRDAAEFRELWPDHTPNELGRLLLVEVDKRGEKLTPKAAQLPELAL